MKKRRLKKWLKYTLVIIYIYIIERLIIESMLSNNKTYVFTALCILLTTNIIIEIKEIKEGKR